ncbi:DUF4426 domain-containing protein [Colwellia sp. UCD-KL20]|uniref:DUF4426 domain-containing protein n=1 Tax=Colwellia sp. UCD-KL20 TaxID=1917165 RepID=UPI000970D713|nr:DUF4426 domain-containing protein [Colwellia sp. UCD-KL20]
MKKFIKRLTLLIITSVFMFNAHAENMKKLEHLDVHYIAFGATFLTPKIAKAYGIERSRYNGVINISVLDNSKEGKPAKHVVITAKARNDLGQIKTLEFEEVTEGDAIYYLAQVTYSDEETYYFDVTINDGTGNKSFKFKQKFYVD